MKHFGGSCLALAMGSTALVGVLGPAIPAYAQSATWAAAPANGTYNNGANWVGGTPASGIGNTATFGTSTTTTVDLTTDLDIGTIRIQNGAAYTFNYGAPATIVGLHSGMDIQAGASATFNVSNGALLQIFGGSMQSAAIVNDATVEFQTAGGSGNAGNATIINNSVLSFYGGSSAGTATITNNGTIGFYGGSRFDAATITTTAGGTVTFADTAIGGTAAFVFTGNGNLDISGLTNSGTTVGSIASPSTTSEVRLGAKRLTTGGNGTSTAFAGVISGVDGSLLKTGSGTLTLTGVNTYSGGTFLNGGVLAISADNNLGASSGGLTLQGGTLQLNGNVTSARTVTLSGGGTINTNGNSMTLSGAVGGAGTLQKSGNGTLTLTNAANSFLGTLLVNAGTLSIDTGAGLTTNAITNSAAITNAGTVSGATTNNALGNILNSATWSGDVSNAGAVNNTGSWTGNAVAGATGQFGNSGTWNGNVSNGFQVTNASTGIWNGDAVNTGTLSNQGTWNGNLTNSASATNDGLWNGAISNSGTFRNNANAVVSGAVTNTGTVDAYGGTFGGTISNAGTFNVLGPVVGNSNFINAVGASLLITVAGNYTLNGSIANAGTVTNVSGGSFTTNAGIDNTVSGLWNGSIVHNASAALHNDGRIIGDVTVNAGTLSGTGTITGSLVVGAATFAPGNSIGTFTVQGNLAFTSASTYLVEIATANSDRINVTGTASPGGARVSAIYANGSYVVRRYTILTASGGVAGSFASLVNTNLPASFRPQLRYDANNVYLDLALDFTPTPTPTPTPSPTPTPEPTPTPTPTPPPPSPSYANGLNRNQASVANALVTSFNTAGGIPLVFGILTPQGLTQVSGEHATGIQQTTFDAMDRFVGILTDPFAGTRTGTGQASAAQGYSDEDESVAHAAKRKRTGAEREAFAAFKAPAKAATYERRWSVWGTGYGGTQQTDGNTAVGSQKFTNHVYGGAAGFDYRLTPETLVGFSLGGAGTSFGLAGGLGGGRSEMFQAGVYGRHTGGPAHVSGALAWGWQDVTTDRNIFANGYRGGFDANAVAGRLEGGWRIAYGTSGVTPYAAGQITSAFLPGYAEQLIAGVNTFALTYAGKDVTASRTELGLRGDTSFAAADAVVTLRGRAAWAHNFSTDRSIAALFQTLPASGFTVFGASPARDAALISAGAEARWLNGFSVAATFEGEFSKVTQSYAGKGVVRYQW